MIIMNIFIILILLLQLPDRILEYTGFIIPVPDLLILWKLESEEICIEAASHHCLGGNRDINAS